MSRRIHFSGKRPLSPLARRSLMDLLNAVLDDHESSGDLSVVYVNDDEIARIHLDYMGKEGATDVITFPIDDEMTQAGEGDVVAPGPRILGEIFISVDTADRESKKREIPLEREIALYTLHGVLHLVGFDDIDPGDRRRMRSAERKYMKRFSSGD